MNQIEIQILICQQQLKLNSLEKEILITKKNLHTTTQSSHCNILQQQLSMLEDYKLALLDHFKMNCPHCCLGLVDLPNGCIGECKHCHGTGRIN